MNQPPTLDAEHWVEGPNLAFNSTYPINNTDNKCIRDRSVFELLYGTQMHAHDQQYQQTTIQQNQSHPRLQLTKTTLQIARLPSAPTFDWTTQAAKSLAQLSEHTSFGVIIAQHDRITNRLTTESTGVCIHTLNEISSEHQARCPLDRLGSSAFNLTPEQLTAGCVVPASTLLPKWTLSPTSDPWTANTPLQTLAAFAPIVPSTQPKTQALALLILACPSPSSLKPVNPEILAAALAAMAYKASDAIRCDSTGTPVWLTQREQVILDHLIIGRSVRAIAESIGRSPHTVHDHVKNLHRKLNASSRGQLIANALGHSDHADPIDLISPIIDPSLADQHSQNTKMVAELKPNGPQQAIPLNRPTIAH